nr:ribonuclease H-like domain, reverse transcriptase, RNA-dependent DNA polymerase [Tanacetum cinerariifolium]
MLVDIFLLVHPHVNKDIGIVDSGCSKSMIGNKDKLDDFMQVKGGTVTFGGGDGYVVIHAVGFLLASIVSAVSSKLG